MVKKADVTDRIYIDEAEGFLLSHALFSPPRTWPPLPPPPSQAERLQRGARKMDWNGTGAGGAGGVGDWFETDEPATGTVAGAAGMDNGDGASTTVKGEANAERCVICLMALRDRAVVGVCGHEFCFECIGVWANQSRRCPLCSADMAPFLLHDLDNVVPTKFYLPPLPTRRWPGGPTIASASASGPSGRRVTSGAMIGIDGQIPHDEPLRGAEQVEKDALDLQIERRKEIYAKGLFVKHIPSNNITLFRPNPSPREIADSPPLMQRATAFLRRELRVFTDTEVEYLLGQTLGLLRGIDIRSEPFIRLLADLLGGLPPPGRTYGADAGAGEEEDGGSEGDAEHLAHELYSWLRSPFKELWRWDEVAQYGMPAGQEGESAAEVVSVPLEGADAVPSVDNHLHEKDPGAVEEPVAAQHPHNNAKPHLDSLSRSRGRSRSQPSDSSASSRSSHSSRSSYDSRSRSGSRSRSRSRSRLPPRNPTRRDTFIPNAQDIRRWDEHDTWIDPDHAAWLEDERDRARARQERHRAKREAKEERRRVAWAERRRGLAPDGHADTGGHDEAQVRGPAGMRAWGLLAEKAGVELLSTEAPDAPAVGSVPGPASMSMSIRGAAVSHQPPPGAPKGPAKRLTLLERLAKAKAEAAASADGAVRAENDDGTDVAAPEGAVAVHAPLTELPPNLPSNPAAITAEDLVLDPITSHGDGATQAPAPRLDLKATIRARIRLRLKLESERANYRHNIAESRAQELRQQILERKLLRQAHETDATLRRMDRLERDREVRRRLMVLKMMAAETDGERRARELKERLGRDKRRKMLKGMLLARKRIKLGDGDRHGRESGVGVGENGVEKGVVGARAELQVDVKRELEPQTIQQVDVGEDDIDWEF